MQRDVEMDPPFIVGDGSLRERAFQRQVEILKADQFTTFSMHDDLVQIHVLGKRRQLLETGRTWTNSQCVADMDLAQSYAVAVQSLQSLLRLFELNREVACVVIDTQMSVEARVAWVLFADLVEESGCFFAILK